MYVESKKLKLSDKNCFQIHIGKGHDSCHKLKVHQSDKNGADSETYLGVIVDNSASIHQKSKGQGMITGIMSIFDEIPL